MLASVLHARPDNPQRLPDVTDVNNVQGVLDLLGQITHILGVRLWQQHRLDAGTVSSDELLLDTAYSLDVTGKLELALEVITVLLVTSCKKLVIQENAFTHSHGHSRRHRSPR